MGNQRPPGGSDEPTHEPQRPQGGGEPQPWADPNRTLRYSDRRSIADRLRGESREPPPLPQHSAEDDTTAGPAGKPVGTPPPKVALARPPRVAFRKRSSGGRLAVFIAVVVVVGLAGGGAAAWFSGWRPPFLGGTTAQPAKPTAEKPAAQPTDPKPGDPSTPQPGTEIGANCLSAVTEVKAGAAACGFALDAQGSLSFQGARFAQRLAVGAGPAQRVVLYPFSPSKRFVFLRACDAPSGGRCDVQRLADTAEKKLTEVKGATGFTWVAWSPKEQIGLVGYRAGATDTIAIVHAASGEVLRPSAIRVAKNRYALVKPDTVRWGRDEQSFSVEVKLCPIGKDGRERNPDCEQDEDVTYRRRTVKFEL